MKLTLDRDDLKEEFTKINCSQTKFYHFKPDVQEAVYVVGRATFQEYDHRNYNAIYPPQD